MKPTKPTRIKITKRKPTANDKKRIKVIIDRINKTIKTK